MDLSKLSTEDLLALKSGNLSKVSTEGLTELKRQMQPSVAQQNLTELSNQGPLDELKGAYNDVANATKAGISGISDLVSGNGLNQAATDVEKVQNDQTPDTTAGKVGEKVGAMVTPAQIAIQAGLGAALTAVGPWAANILKGWGEQAALNAAGIIKRIGSAFGLDNLEGLAQFLLQPVKVGNEELPAIVDATSSTASMLEKAKAVQLAAGKALEDISSNVDESIRGVDEFNDVADNSFIPRKELPIDWEKMMTDLETFKSEIEENAPSLGETVVNQYEKAIEDADRWVQKAMSGTSDSLFSDLGELKTALGKLIFKHGKAVDSKAELQDAYNVVNEALKGAAKQSSPENGAAYEAMNAIYHKATAVVQALEGKATGLAVKDLFTFGVPSLMGSMVGGIPGAIAGGLAGAAWKGYGPQVMASGLTKAATALPYLAKAAANVPAVGILSGLAQ